MTVHTESACNMLVFDVFCNMSVGSDPMYGLADSALVEGE